MTAPEKPEPQVNPIEDIRRLMRRTSLGFVVLVLFVGGWAATAPLSGAVIARGVIAVESNLKTIQHATGGIVREILVQDGARVAEGDLLLRLDSLEARTTLAVLKAQWVALKSREARLVAERDDLPEMAMPAALAVLASDPVVDQAMAGERSLFASRRAARESLSTQLKERQNQLAQEQLGLGRLIAMRQKESGLIGRELKGVDYLFKKGLATTNRLVSLQRDLARLEADRIQFSGDMDRTKGRASEIDLELIRRKNETLSEVVDGLRDIQVKLAELDERRRSAVETLARLDIKAPRSGVVLGSRVHTLGGVVGAGEALMRIVPEDDPLVVEARVSPRDIDQVAVGANATVRVLTGNGRTASSIEGKVLGISADLARDDRSGEGFFLVRISLERAEAERAVGVRLQSGMGAEAFIRTGDRTALAYLLQPVSDQLSRAMRER